MKCRVFGRVVYYAANCRPTPFLVQMHGITESIEVEVSNNFMFFLCSALMCDVSSKYIKSHSAIIAYRSLAERHLECRLFHAARRRAGGANLRPARRYAFTECPLKIGVSVDYSMPRQDGEHPTGLRHFILVFSA